VLEAKSEAFDEFSKATADEVEDILSTVEAT
jgi:hypothetical protein